MQAKSLRAMVLGAAFGVLALVPSQAQAQIQAQATYNLDAEMFAFGAGYNFGLGSLTEKHGITAVATFDYYLPKSYDFFGGYKYNLWEVNANGKMDIKSVAGLYVGAGAGISHSSFSYDIEGAQGAGSGSSDFHLNILGGWNFASKSKGPFVEAGFTLGDGSALRIGGGIRF